MSGWATVDRFLCTGGRGGPPTFLLPVPFLCYDLFLGFGIRAQARRLYAEAQLPAASGWGFRFFDRAKRAKDAAGSSWDQGQQKDRSGTGQGPEPSSSCSSP